MEIFVQFFGHIKNVANQIRLIFVIASSVETKF